jgi:PASTA domain
MPVNQFGQGYDCGVGWVIAAGPDGRLWFQAGQDQIAAMGTDGTVTEYTVPGVPAGDGLDIAGIAAGPDARMWFGDSSVTGIGAITTAGNMQFYTANAPCPGGSPKCARPIPLFSLPTSIVSGPDGRVWFVADETYDAITTSGQVTQFTSPSGPPCSGGALPAIASGPDGRLWLTEVFTYCEGGAEDGDKIFGETTSGGSSVTTSVPACSVPNLKGMTLAAARRTLTSDHCTLGKVTHKYTSGKENRVLSQKPKPGSKLKAGGKVALVLSAPKGKASKSSRPKRSTR